VGHGDEHPAAQPRRALRRPPRAVQHKDLTVRDLLKHVKGPGFPPAGKVLNSKSELKEIYENGRARSGPRGGGSWRSCRRGGKQIVYLHPYAVNKSNLVMKFGDLVRRGS